MHSLPAAYDKLVVLIIDALRYDFVFSPREEDMAGCATNAAGALPWPEMPRTLKLLAEAVSPWLAKERTKPGRSQKMESHCCCRL